MNDTNMQLWETLGKTDPKHTKPFTRSGGFKGTAIKPMWAYQLMTEQFGPCGSGWGINKPEFDVQHMSNETVVYCTVSVWYEKPEKVAWGVGGDKCRTTRGNGNEFVDDEAYKKAFTDAVTNALKFIGVGADVHMGMFDDNKYVNTLQAEFSQENGNTKKSSAQLKRDGVWEEFDRELAECQTLVTLEKFKAEWRNKAKSDGWNKTYLEAAADRIEGREKEIREAA